MPKSQFRAALAVLGMAISLTFVSGHKVFAQSFEPLRGFKVVDRSWMFDNGSTRRPVQAARQSLAASTRGIVFVGVTVRDNDMLLTQHLPTGDVTETIAFQDIDIAHLGITSHDTDYIILSIPLKAPAAQSGVDTSLTGSPPRHARASSPVLIPVATDLVTAAQAIQDLYDVSCSAQGNCGAEISGR